MSACCPHSEKDHCKGGESHDGYKYTMRMARDPNPTICRTRHCTAAICDCLNYEPDIAIPKAIPKVQKAWEP